MNSRKITLMFVCTRMGIIDQKGRWPCSVFNKGVGGKLHCWKWIYN